MRIIVDIDGTCANGDHRNHFLQQEPRQWDLWHAGCMDDTPHEHIKAILWGMYMQGITPVYITGRMERSRVNTTLWLNKHRFPLGPIFMRPEDDHRDDTEIKTEILARESLTPENILFVLEDRDRVVKMWRDLGFKCLQVAEGDF